MNSSMKKFGILFGIICFSAGYATHFILNNKSEKSVTSTAEVASVTPSLANKSSRELTAEIILLKQRIAYLEGQSPQYALRSSAASTSQPTNNKSTPSISVPSTSDDVASLRAYQLNNEIKKHQDYLQKLGATTENMPRVLAENFNKEPVDPVWAGNQKDLLDNFIQKNEGLAALPNISSECRTQQCRVSVLTDDAQSMAKLSEAMTKLMDSKEPGFNSYNVVIDPISHSTNIYFERNP